MNSCANTNKDNVYLHIYNQIKVNFIYEFKLKKNSQASNINKVKIDANRVQAHCLGPCKALIILASCHLNN